MFRLTSVGSLAAAAFLAAVPLALACGGGHGSGDVAVATPGPGPFVAEFVGTVDPRAGTITFEQVPVRGQLASLQTITVVQDHNPGTGPDNTLELVTGATGYDAFCGRLNTFCADVTIRSFFLTQEVHNIFLEITDMNPPTSHLGLAKTATPAAGQPGSGDNLDPTYGLWAYPALMDKTRSDLGGTTPVGGFHRAGINAASRRLIFDMGDGLPWLFHAVIWGEFQPSLATDTIDANCGGVLTPLHSPLCGECGRTSARTCTYDGGVPTDPAHPEYGYQLNFDPGCNAIGQAACDNGSSMAISCVDVSTSDANCGICGNACAANEHCVAGACTPRGTCPTDSTLCSGSPNFCCPAGTSCGEGFCTLSDAFDISVGSTFACALTNSSRVPSGTTFDGFPASVPNNAVCWGAMWIDALGSPTWTRAQTVPEYLSTTGNHLEAGLRQVSAGGRRTGFLGPGTIGILGPSYYLGPGTPFIYSWTTRTDKVSTGGSHGCSTFVFYSTSDPQGVFCYGPDNSPQLGMGPAPGRCEEGACVIPSLLGMPWLGAADPNSGSMTATDISSAGDTTCVVLAAPPTTGHHGEGQTAGTVACWGSNASGQVTGIGSGSYNTPQVVANVSNAVAVSVGGTHTVALLANGSLAFWGSNDYGQFGTAKSGTSNVTILAPQPGEPPLLIAAGQDFTCYSTALDVYCAGRNDLSQLGLGAPSAPIGAFTRLDFGPVRALSAGGVPASGDPIHGSACLVDTVGYAQCWGDNTHSQAGNGTAAPAPWPLPVQFAPFAASGL